ncbi:MAG: NAD(P)-dependent alcohol dehydrogenase [Lentisphaeria bacterium]|nr:NAD(P)-dependent alcohol dehydrogenase [Lentisphaeria bacterium]
MKGFAMLGIGRTGWIEKPRPACGPLDAVVRPLAVAPCTSDIHTVWEGALGERTDMILGHEACGIVEETGALVRDFKPGDRVIVSAITPDWGDLNSQRGFPMHSTGMLAGWKFSNFKDGVFGEYFHVNEADANLARLPDGMDPGIGAMVCDMMPTGFHAAELADVQFGDDVVVIGIGPVGLMATAACVLRGAANVYCVGTRAKCREVAAVYGATGFLSYKDGDLAEQVLDLTGGKGVDRVCIAGGTVDTFDAAIRMLKPGGAIGSVNYLGDGDAVQIPRVEWGCGMSHKTIRCGLMPGGRLRSEKLAALITAGRIDPGLLITHRYHGMEHMEEALLMMRSKAPDLIKPVVYCD